MKQDNHDNHSVADSHEHARKHMKRHRRLKGVMIGAIALGILVIIAVGMIIFGSDKKHSGEATQKLQEILQASSVAQKKVVVKSGFGFTIPYDPNLYESYAIVSNTKETRKGYVSGEDFSNDELATPRNYTIVRLTSKEAKETAKQTGNLLAPQLSISTNYHKDYFDRSKLDAKYKDMTDLDVLLDREKAQVTKDGDSIKSATKIKVGSQDFYKVIVVHTYEGLGTQVSTYNYRYLTVHDASPYWFQIGPSLSERSLQYVPQYESLIAATSFSTHDDNSLVKAPSAVSLASADIGNTSLTEGYVNTSDLINIVARNQIATVRVGSLRCADFTLTSGNASVTIKDACSAGIGSGSIVSSDGYVITNGHVVYVKDLWTFEGGMNESNNVQSLYEYLLQANFTTYAELSNLYNQAKSGDSTALINLVESAYARSDVKISNDKSSYSIQTSDVPMRLDMSGPRYTWVDQKGTVAGGTLIDYDLDKADSALNPSSSHTDVAVLKFNGTYPTVRLSNLSSLEAGKTITTLGYPAIVDDGLTTTKTSTLPTASQGTVNQLFQDAGNHLLVYSNAQIAAGNSGGPAFDQSGKQIGLNTYGGSACDSKGGNNCFGNAVTRDAADASALLKSNGIAINESDEYSLLWNEAIDSFLAAEYGVATQKLTALNEKYPDNYLVGKLTTASAGLAKENNQSTVAGPQSNAAIIVLVIAGVLILIVIIGVVIAIQRSKRHPHYYMPAVDASPMPLQTQQYATAQTQSTPGVTAEPQRPQQVPSASTSPYPTQVTLQTTPTPVVSSPPAHNMQAPPYEPRPSIKVGVQQDSTDHINQ